MMDNTFQSKLFFTIQCADFVTVFSNLHLSAKQFRTLFKTINWKTRSFWNLFLHFFLPRTCSSVPLTFHKNVLKCVILLLFHYFCFLLCLTSLKNSRCAGKKIIYVASTVSDKIKPTQRGFFHPTTCNRINIVPRKMHFSSRSQGHLTLIRLKNKPSNSWPPHNIVVENI